MEAAEAGLDVKHLRSRQRANRAPEPRSECVAVRHDHVITPGITGEDPTGTRECEEHRRKPADHAVDRLCLCLPVDEHVVRRRQTEHLNRSCDRLAC